MNRYADWMAQAERDLRHARNALADRDFEWAAFAAQQAAEKAAKAAIYAAGGEPWGHSVVGLFEAIGDVPAEVLDAARRLDKHYFPTRYPNGLPAGYPGAVYTEKEARDAIADAETVLGHCRGRLPGS